ncbi:hypothetical protein H112_05292 [Trichophyton rubrum D6]|uniref:Uncharacterized protein n=3 Tax=Trichophyton TaxID=5550 RepID=A0A080WFH1_TRIRC|nr:uncharacterized protein TERG_11933 [Trichophyton rubrum CBS 118892]EZF20263.1 hypothetical protein H100_05314 [Trichophyton rubrum MR850]EZF40826.1 hypothetical protein H102_05303 [Trichophyton rubrum CBS 100081]EZF51444.1 hypothetical protein H103_05305 [Trichophyton rubrum CBS 288.86]EZF62027.1 hypothetical protein H104_05295 [Trichophyton rubrum CBS 289.86]EZF72718.1 hypothetical protein H105_05323 [Trichophyton soudanense CBS 452.61]EZF83498.1 hypothetical protein H110_05302 [Trichophy
MINYPARSMTPFPLGLDYFNTFSLRLELHLSRAHLLEFFSLWDCFLLLLFLPAMCFLLLFICLHSHFFARNSPPMSDGLSDRLDDSFFIPKKQARGVWVYNLPGS